MAYFCTVPDLTFPIPVRSNTSKTKAAVFFKAGGAIFLHLRRKKKGGKSKRVTRDATLHNSIFSAIPCQQRD